MKYSLLSILLVLGLSFVSFAQDIKEVASKMQFPGNLPTPRFIVSWPDSINGVSIVYEDIKAITKEKLSKLKNIELIELKFSSQLELDEEVKLLPNFPNMKYLILGDWRFGSKLSEDKLKLPNALANYINVEAIRFDGKWKIDYEDGLQILKELPSLKYLFFIGIEQPFPERIKEFKQLKGISLQSKFVDFPEWIIELPNLETISLDLAMYDFNGSSYLDYFEVLNKLQQLPSIKSLYFSSIFKITGDFSKIRFKKLEKISLSRADFRSNPKFINFLTNQRKLKWIDISSYSSVILNKDFSKLKKLADLTIRSGNDSLNINFNLSNSKNLKRLKLSGSNIFLKHGSFPRNLEMLDLSSSSLKLQPNQVSSLKKLETLDLSYDSLEFLPKNFGRLKRLKHLNLSSNKIKNIPSYFCEFKYLEDLNLGSNPIEELPQNIGNLNKLETLELQHSNLKSLPASFGKLVNLEILEAEDNFITQLPQNFISLTKLKKLNFSNNQLLRLPKEIGELAALESLNLSFNNIEHLPVSIGNLQSLKILSLGFNNLDSLPREISKLNSLQELYLNPGEIKRLKSYNYGRAIYRKDDPNPNRRITSNNIKNFPRDLSAWKSLRKISLDNNSQINSGDLIAGLFSIPAKGFSADLENCNITTLPQFGWDVFYAKSLNLARNRINKIPATILDAPYLQELNLKENELSATPTNLNQYVNDRYEKMLWFVDLGIITDMDLPRNDSMVLALVKKSSNYYYKRNFKQSINFANRAIAINDSLANTKISLTDIGESSYEIGNYKEAISYLTKAIRRDTAGSVRIMNFVTPDFEFRAKSYLKLGDTLSAIKDYETLAKTFHSDNWGDIGLLYRSIGKPDEANLAFETGIKKYEEQIAYFKKTKQDVGMYQLSLLELMIVKEDFDRAEKYAVELENKFQSISQLTLLRYLSACAAIGNNSFDLKNKPGLEKFIVANKNSVSGWGYDLFFKWLRVTKISKQKESLMRVLTDSIKPEY